MMKDLKIVVDGSTYVDARWVEKEYQLSRCKCRRILLASQLEYVKEFNRFFYKQVEVEAYLSNLK